MAEHFSFFDPVQLPDGTYDREYNAQQFTKYFGVLVTTGVMKGTGNMLAVSANGSNMVTKIDTGIAFVEAKYYENDSFKELTHDTETLGNSRIDRIVVRMDLSTEARSVKSFIKKGVPSTNPVVPSLTQTPNLYEISLAQVKVVGGQTFIAEDAITDERGTAGVCPWAGSNILPSYDDNALAEHLIDNGRHLTQGDRIVLGNAASKVNQEYNTDPNTTLASLILTNTNVPSSDFWYIHTIFYNSASLESNKAQYALSYGSPGFAYRNQRGGVWTPWTIVAKSELPKPINATVLSGWANHDAGNPLRFYKDSFGVVHLYGRVKSTTASTAKVATMPLGYRPLTDRSAAQLSGITNAASAEVLTNGDVIALISNIAVGSNILIDISFPTTIQ